MTIEDETDDSKKRKRGGNDEDEEAETEKELIAVESKYPDPALEKDPRKRKLMELKIKMEKGRVENRRGVQAEAKRMTVSEGAQQREAMKVDRHTTKIALWQAVPYCIVDTSILFSISFLNHLCHVIVAARFLCSRKFCRFLLRESFCQQKSRIDKITILPPSLHYIHNFFSLSPPSAR